jgi:SAM-dependent methyltransferase
MDFTRPSIMRAVRALRKQRRRTWRRRADPVRGRRRALAEEVDYWEHWLSTRGGAWAADYSYRFNPNAEVADPLLRDALEAMNQAEVSILDVGAGPVSTVGYRFEGAPISLVAVDPLASRYNRLIDRSGAIPPVRTEELKGEQLLRRFEPGHFDIAYSRNALDHAVDPLLIIEQMLAVVRPGGRVVLRHARNEAVKESYVQLHQWNFEERRGQLIVWSPHHETNVSQVLADRAEVVCLREPGDADAPVEDDPGWVVCMITKLGA